ncbi:MAG TPA: hypothetical protein DD429_06205 [Clostridiaceae bacterium]|nr:hypothetical protein [Clostridiaceae bacterium]
MSVDQERLPITLIIDGEVIKQNLIIAKISETDLKNVLDKNGVLSYKQVLFAGLDSAGKFFYQKKQNLKDR